MEGLGRGGRGRTRLLDRLVLWGLRATRLEVDCNDSISAMTKESD